MIEIRGSNGWYDNTGYLIDDNHFKSRAASHFLVIRNSFELNLIWLLTIVELNSY